MKRIALTASLLMLIASTLLMACASEQPVDEISAVQMAACTDIADHSERNRCMDANH
jgi:hypothetical protein